MRIVRRLGCALLGLVLAAQLCACGGGSGYQIIDTYSAEGSYVIAFRQDDRLCELVTAVLGQLARNGTLRSASYAWFGEDLTSLRGPAGETEDPRAGAEERTITVGVDVTNMPMSYETSAGYEGFDIDLASYICGYLGWSMTIYPIDPGDVAVELQSGDIDLAMGVAESAEVSALSYSPAYLTSRYVLVSRSGVSRDKTALRGKTLGVALSDLDVLQQDESFVSSLEGVIYQTDTAGLFQALMLGQVDAILVSSVVAAYYMK